MSSAKSKLLFPESAPAPPTPAEKAALEIIKTVRAPPRDVRFTNTNQAPHCWSAYNEWVMCLKETGNDEQKCMKMRQIAVSTCPYIWYEKWDEERDEGTFPGIQMQDKPKGGH